MILNLKTATMKSHILLPVLLLVAASSMAQQTEPQNPSHPFSKDYYLKKSKSNKTAAWVMIAAGTVLVGTGIGVGFNEVSDQFANLFTAEEEKSSNTGTILFFTGLATTAASIPLFIASGKNRKKASAVSASIKMEKSMLVRQQSFVTARYPALSLRLNLN